MKNKALLIHHDSYEAVKMLTPYESGLLFQALLDYDINGIKPEFEDRTVAVIFLQMKKTLDSNRERYEKISESRSKNAKKRWNTSENAKKETAMQMHDLALNTNINTNTNSSTSLNTNTKSNTNANENTNENECVCVNKNKKTTAVIPGKESAEENKHTQKNTYGEFKNVFLSDEEYKKLTEKIPDGMSRIDSLSAYIKSTGKIYPDHYAQLINWHLFTKNESVVPPIRRPPGERREPTFDIDEFTKKAIGIKYVPPKKE